ncbi:MAG: diaminopimelate decarboxylase [Saprospiraceae bacterium]
MQLTDGKFRMAGDIDPLELCKKYGTPLYVYDGEKIEGQYKRITSAFNVKKLEIHYACKANTNLSVLQLLNDLGSGLDCVSIEEVELGIKAGFDPKVITFTPNSVGIEEYEKAVEIGVKVNVDSISILEQFGQKFSNYPVSIRINPHVMAGMYSQISVGHIDSKFGISIHQLPLVMRVIEETKQKVNGIHMHTGSDILDVDIFLNAAEILLDVARNFEDLDFIDFGSGFKVKYKMNDYETNIEEFGRVFSERFNEFCNEYGKDLTLIFEPGKFLVSESGYFFVKANVVKQTTSTVFICVDSGFNHLIRPMFYNAFHRIENITDPNGRQRIYTVVGNICESDTFGVNRRIAETIEGDILCMYNAGAYCFAMASNYNSRVRPAEVLIYKGKDYLIRKRETIKDILRNQVHVNVLQNEPALKD